MRPSFSSMWHSFQKIYKQGDLTYTGDIIGGKVKQNIDAGTFENLCAIRMSYVLNKNGVSVPFKAGATSSGANKDWYFFKINDLIQFVNQKLGKPDFESNKFDRLALQGKSGILIIRASFLDATGHATLWNGSACSDNCYADRATQISFWKLP